VRTNIDVLNAQSQYLLDAPEPDPRRGSIRCWRSSASRPPQGTLNEDDVKAINALLE
jgi:hypothetical protein